MPDAPRPADPSASELVQEAARLDAIGDIAAAEGALRRALDGLARQGDPPSAATASLRAVAAARLSALCRYDGRIPEAAEHVARALADASVAGDSMTRTEVATEAAIVAIERGDLPEAAARADSAVASALELPEGRTRAAMLATALQGRAAAARQLGGDAQAAGDLLEAQSYARTAYGPDSLELASILVQRGAMATVARSFDEATILLRRALGIVRRHGGRHHPDVAVIEQHLGWLELARGNPAVAVTHARRALALRTEALGAEHPATALSKVALAAALTRVGGRGEARQLLEAALPTLEAKLGPDHVEVAGARASLTDLVEGR